MSQPPRHYVRSEADAYVVEGEAVRLGADVLIYLWGGDRPHIGAVAAAQPRPSLAHPETTSATASVLTYPGHKEDAVVKTVAEALAASLECNVVVSAGIHWDDLPPEGIAAVMEHCREVTDKLAAALAGPTANREV